MEKIIVSKCLLGYPCRYDGKSVPCKEVMDLQDRYELIPVCPEELGGLPTPRIPAEIVGDKILRADGADVTGEYILGAKLAYTYAAENGCTLAILKSKSPSCGKGEIYDGTYTRTLIIGNGILTDLLLKNNIEVYTETEIDKL